MLQPTFVGLDLGSYRTSAVASDGQHVSIPSAVAWPSDVFWDDVADGICQFGEHLAESNPELDIVYPMQKAAFKFLDATDAGLNSDQEAQARYSLKLLARHAVREVSPMSSLPLFGVVGCPARASHANRLLLLELIQDLFTGAMIVPDSILVAFATGRTNEALVIDIGAGKTDISPIIDGELRTHDCITLPMGGDWIEDVLLHEIEAAHPGLPVPRNTLREIKELFGTLFESSSPATVSVIDEDQQTELDVRDAITTACGIVGPSISNALHEVLSAFDAKTARRLTANTILIGGTSRLDGVSDWVTHALSEFGTPRIQRIDEAAQLCAIGACRIAEATATQNWSRLAELNVAQEVLRAA